MAEQNTDGQHHAGALAIEYRNIDSLIPYINNARTHSDEQVAQIAASIREFGWTNPVLVDGDNGIIAGHGRVQAARKLDMASVPVIELHGLSDAQRRAYVLADNRLAENAEWDEVAIRGEFENLAIANFDMSLTGFADWELSLFSDSLLADIEPDDSPDSFDEIEPDVISSQYRCPSCNYEWSGSPQ
jgi:ParB-like chromosome segregation protein Spo0J